MPGCDSAAFRERADTTYELFKAPGTAFLVVAAPERDALREASYFVERLSIEGMPLAGLVLNRVHRRRRLGCPPTAAMAGGGELEETATSRSPPSLLRLHADRMLVVAREQGLRERFTAAHAAVPSWRSGAARGRARPGRAAGDRRGAGFLAAQDDDRPGHSPYAQASR